MEGPIHGTSPNKQLCEIAVIRCADHEVVVALRVRRTIPQVQETRCAHRASSCFAQIRNWMCPSLVGRENV